LQARGFGEFFALDLGIVRGLAYYTGTVFEIFDSSKAMRAVAGGGRYDTLVKTLGGVDLAATGFAMGDYVIRNLIEETPAAMLQMEAWLQRQNASDIFLVLADEGKRAEALRDITLLRAAGLSCDLPLAPAKVNKQFQRAEQSGARFALVIGSEYPAVTLKVLASRSEESGHAGNLVPWLTERVQQPDGPLLA
jgi:histidyl-tRNA synthetase